MKRLISIVLATVMLFALMPLSAFAETDPLTYTLSDDGTYYIVTGCDYDATSVTIPAEYEGLPVKEIGVEAFDWHQELANVEIPNTITTIGEDAFGACGIVSIEIPTSVTTIANSAFSICEFLSVIMVAEDNEFYHVAGNCLIETKTKTLVRGCNDSIIPDDGSVTIIGSDAFSGCGKLENVEIPDCVTVIEEAAFSRCNSLISIKIPDSVTSIEAFAFSSCYCLEYIEISSLLVTIGDGAFYECRSLANIEIPNSVTTIGISAFEHCISLTYVEIPKSVIEMGNCAFYNVYDLTDIYCEVESKPEGWDAVWCNTNVSTIYWGCDLSDNTTDTPETVHGDIDGNGEVEADDYILLKRVYFGMAKNVDLSICDVNGDGEVNADDYILLKRVFFGMAKL